MSSKYKTSLFLPRKKKSCIDFTTHTHPPTHRCSVLHTDTLHHSASQVAQWWKVCLLTQEMSETWVWFLGWEEPLEEEMATHFNILAWKIAWTEKPGGLQSTGSHTVEDDWAQTHISDHSIEQWRSTLY